MSASLHSLRPHGVSHFTLCGRQCVLHRAPTRTLRDHGRSAAAAESVAGVIPKGDQKVTKAAADGEIVDTTHEIWKSFATNVAGEWEGVTATFTPRGEPEQLPEHYVPSAFRDWGVELWDWQSQCSSTAGSDGSKQLKSTVRRLMPTVGCEADAIAFTEEQSGDSSSSSTDGTAAASNVVLIARGDGSYNTGPKSWPSDERVSTVQIEHCLALSQTDKSQQKFRVKIVQNFKRAWTAGRPWKLASIDLHKEKFDGPYTGKRELAGCGGGQPGIAQQPPLTLQDLEGAWRVCTDMNFANAPENVVVDSTDGTCKSLALLSAGVEPATWDVLEDTGAEKSDAVIIRTLLPLGAWSYVQMSALGRVSTAAAGVLFSQPSAVMSVPAETEKHGAEASSWRMCSSRAYSEDGVYAHGAIAVQKQQESV